MHKKLVLLTAVILSVLAFTTAAAAQPTPNTTDAPDNDTTVNETGETNATNETNETETVNVTVDQNASTVLLASADDYPDAMVASVAAETHDAALMLIQGQELSNATRDRIDQVDPSRVIAVGGPGIISEDVLTALQDDGYETTRLAGVTRYGTAAQVAEYFWPNGTDSAVLVQSDQGDQEFQTLSAAAEVAKDEGAPVYLTPSEQVPAMVLGSLETMNVEQVTVAGANVSDEYTANLDELDITVDEELTAESEEALMMQLTNRTLQAMDEDDQLYVLVTDRFESAVVAGTVPNASMIHAANDTNVTEMGDQLDDVGIENVTLVGPEEQTGELAATLEEEYNMSVTTLTDEALLTAYGLSLPPEQGQEPVGTENETAENATAENDTGENTSLPEAPAPTETTETSGANEPAAFSTQSIAFHDGDGQDGDNQTPQEQEQAVEENTTANETNVTGNETEPATAANATDGNATQANQTVDRNWTAPELFNDTELGQDFQLRVAVLIEQAATLVGPDASERAQASLDDARQLLEDGEALAAREAALDAINTARFDTTQDAAGLQEAVAEETMSVDDFVNQTADRNVDGADAFADELRNASLVEQLAVFELFRFTAAEQEEQIITQTVETDEGPFLQRFSQAAQQVRQQPEEQPTGNATGNQTGNATGELPQEQVQSLEENVTSGNETMNESDFRNESATPVAGDDFRFSTRCVTGDASGSHTVRTVASVVAVNGTVILPDPNYNATSNVTVNEDEQTATADIRFTQNPGVGIQCLGEGTFMQVLDLNTGEWTVDVNVAVDNETVMSSTESVTVQDTGQETVPENASDENQTDGNGGQATSVSLVDNAFQPEEITVTQGDEIRFENNGENTHNVNIDELGVDRDLAPGESFTVTADQTGTFDLVCNYHEPEMTGSVTVTAGEA